MPITRSQKGTEKQKSSQEIVSDQQRPRVFRTPPASPSARQSSAPPTSVQVTDDLVPGLSSRQEASDMLLASGTPATTADTVATQLFAPMLAAISGYDANAADRVAATGYDASAADRVAATGYDANAADRVAATGYDTRAADGVAATGYDAPPVRREAIGHYDVPRVIHVAHSADEVPPPLPPRGRDDSVRTTGSTAARRRLAEFEAKKKLAEIKRRQLELEADLIRKKLELDVAIIEQEGSNASIADEHLEAEKAQRVERWLNESGDLMRDTSQLRDENQLRGASQFRGESNLRNAQKLRDLNRIREDRRLRGVNVVAPEDLPAVGVEVEAGRRTAEAYGFQQSRSLRGRSPSPPRRYDRRERSLTPARSKERGIERLADALESMIKRRPPPRQAQELPIFHGDALEWMPFKAKMRASTEMFQFSADENLARLQSCLRGEAKNAVAGLLYTATDPEIIMRTLEQRFGRPEVITDKTLEEIRRLPRLGASAEELNDFAVRLQSTVCILTSIDNKGYLYNPTLTRDVLEKLSPHLKARWCDYAEEHRASSSGYTTIGEPEIVTLSRFLMREADRTLRHTYSGTAAPKNKEVLPQKKPKTLMFPARKADGHVKGAAVYAATATADLEQKCSFCGDQHRIEKCKKFLSMTVEERWTWAKGQKICFTCLRSGHRRFFCKAKRCGVRECQLKHHALLHSERATPEEKPAATEAPEEQEEKVMSASVSRATQEKATVLLKVCPVTVKGPGGLQVETYALLDEGATISLVDQELASMLHAEGPTRPLHIHAVTSSQREMSQRVRLSLRGRVNEEEYEIEAYTMRDFKAGSQSIDRESLSFEHLKGLPAEDMVYEHARPKLLIGADNWHLIVSRKLLTGKRNEPVASLTLLGWTLHGTLPRGRLEEDEHRVLHLYATRGEKDIREFASADEKLDDLIRQYYEVDSLGISIKARPRKSDSRAEQCFANTVKNIGGRYEVGLPWKEDEPRMPPSYEMAKKRFDSIEKKMQKSKEFKTAYVAQMNNMLTKGYAELAKEHEKHTDRCWYLPHFGVTNPNKPGKLRLVFDAAARANGVCLNDFLLDGPDLLKPLPGILFRFREEKIAVTADIREMFLQVKIRPQDQPAQMFLWRENPEEELKEYVMTSMIFGARSSPFLAHSVRDHNAREHGVENPLALRAITENHYMDDYVDSYATEAKAVATIAEVRRVHQHAGFVIASWDSNVSGALKDIPEELRARQPKEMGKSTQNGKTLGLIWAAETDELLFNTEMPRVPRAVKDLERPPTKREALSAVMSVFDPLGLLSWLTITAKILLQDLWRQKKVGWDDELPAEDTERFAGWMETIFNVASLRLPRCYANTGGVRERQLHVFSDASEKAYATAVYWRFKYDDGSVDVRLAAAKAKVAPIKTQSIPRLELQANLIGARLADAVTNEHRIKPDRTVFWTDSTTALQWIRNEEKRYTPYVAHRLGEIAERTTQDQWRWLPTTENVADEATRSNFSVKTSEDRWFTGPGFLYESEESWPREKEPIQEVAKSMHVRENENKEIEDCGRRWLPEVTRFSSYERLVRTTARVLLFIEMCRRQANKLELRHIEKAERCLIMKAQKDSFSEDIRRLERGQPISPSSRIAKLDPIIVDGVLRVRGRIDAAEVRKESKQPVILDGRHPFTQLLIQDHHKRALHANRERVVNDLRQRYMILRLRPTVRAVENSCHFCRMRKKKPQIPVTGNLPAERLGAYARPFTYCGVDYFGPIVITIGRRHEKRWCALFTCLTVRAVHLELVHTLTTDSAIMALRRMAARRGWPRIIYSDNGTNFRGADIELKKAVEEWTPALTNYALLKRTEWKFIAPGAPNQGGAWERLVRSVKTALMTVLTEKYPKEEVLHTLLAEAESCVNSRPLTHVSVDAADPEALTPNHFLLGGPADLPIIGPSDVADRRTWRAAQGLANEFWRRWIREYLPTLLPRGESRGSQMDVKEGALVIVVDETLPRNVWPRGVVSRVFHGPDGIVRNVEIRTRGGLLRRPVRKLVVLHVEE